MAAALARRQAANEEGSLRPTHLPRDLYQIAELVEVCFGPMLDANGRASVREMKTLGRLGPLLWVVDLLETVNLGLGRGFVWRIGGRVKGNVSIYTGGVHPWLGRGWLIANVAVHPDYQRRGIARSLMLAAMDLIRDKLRGQWVALEVEENNEPAVRLYDSLGFQRYETLHHWESGYSTRLPLASPPAGVWNVRPRAVGDSAAETDLVFGRARIGGMAWTQTLTHHDVGDGLLSSMTHWIEASRGRWVLPDPARPDDLLGALWLEPSGWRNSRLTLFIDPALTDSAGRQALLAYALSLPELSDRVLRVETLAHDPAVEDLLRNAGFRKVRSLVQMRYPFKQG